MATIENEGFVSADAFMGQIASMPDEVLLAQNLVQQGAVHAVSWLLANGCTEQNGAEMLESLRINATLIREEARRRGKPELFERDQTVFS